MVAVLRGSLFRIALSLLILIQDCGMDSSLAEELMGPTLKFALVFRNLSQRNIGQALPHPSPLFFSLDLFWDGCFCC